MDAETRIAWRPQPGPQTALVHCPVSEIFYGGARGGGKTDGMLGKFAIKAARYGEHCVGVFFRRSREDLKEAIERSKQIYGLIGAKWHEQKKWWVFPNGARLKFEYLDNDSDADNYQGHNYTDVFFEEITHWPDPTPINKLRATLRSAVGVPCQFHATGNPGGPGHNWVKARYIDPEPKGWKILQEEFTNPFTKEVVRKDRVFIPSKLSDNRYLGGQYVANLYQSGSVNLVRAWLAGDWDVIEGAYFDCWDPAKHIVLPFTVPPHWAMFGSFDWGFAKPASYGLWAVADGEPVRNINNEEVEYPSGALIRIGEVYTAKEPNVGRRLEVPDLAAEIKELERQRAMRWRAADPAVFQQDGGPSIAERMLASGVTFIPADNKRIAGWSQMRQRLIGFDGVPMIYCFSTCKDSIRTIPTLQHDEKKAEDLDTDGEDHAADDWRYMCMARPLVGRAPPVEAEQIIKPPTYGDITKRHFAAMARKRE